jgi:quercetin dioxygenase-like cupin family protein
MANRYGEIKMAKVFDLNKLAKFSNKKGLLSGMEDRRQIKKDLLKTDNYNLVLICLDTDQEIPSRPEPYAVCFYVIDGKGMFTVGKEQFELSSGGMIFVPANEARGILSKEKLTLLGIQDPH